MTLEKERSHNDDIRIFIESQLRFEEDVDVGILQQIRAEILEKSSGIFLWVNLVVHQLNEVLRQDGRMKAVQQRLREIPEAAKQRPAPNGAMPLYSLFKDIIQKDQKNISELVRIAQIIFCSRRPLHPKELYILLRQEYEFPFDSSEISYKILIKHVLEVSKGLAEVTKSAEPTVQFIHETVREFLRDGGLSSISTQSIDRHGHEALKASCLRQIQAPVAKHLESLVDYLLHRDVKGHNDAGPWQNNFREQAHAEFPFLEYAAKNLLFHADEAESMGASQRKFLESFPTSVWAPIFNLFEKTRQHGGEDKPLLYILAEHGCVHLIRSSAESRRQRAQEVNGNEFSSALSCAIFNGNVDVALKLVGLHAESRPQDAIPPRRRGHFHWHPSLIHQLQVLGDVHLTRRILEEWYTMDDSDKNKINFHLVKSAEMIDLFLEFSSVPGFPSAGKGHDELQEDEEAPEIPRSRTDLIFIRRAIEEMPRLLQSKDWGGKTMLDYAIDRDLQSLVSLYLEYSGGQQSVLDDVLHCAAAKGSLPITAFSYQCGANLRSQNQNGQIALHLAAAGYEETLQYLLDKDPSCVNIRDLEGRTALAVAAHGLSHPFRRIRPRCLETFLRAGADPNTVVKCHECNDHELPLAAFMALSGDIFHFRIVASDDRCNLNGRDSFGRTALSWCFVRRRGNKVFGHPGYESPLYEEAAGLIGKQLLQQPAVDVNSRDDSGCTILEHFIRCATPSEQDRGPDFKSFVHRFFQSTRLDPNLQTSNGQAPLALIVSLYDTWPAEFGDINSGWGTYQYRVLGANSEARQKAFNMHLIQTFKLLLGTGKVDIDAQRRCAEQAAPELKSLILGSRD